MKGAPPPQCTQLSKSWVLPHPRENARPMTPTLQWQFSSILGVVWLSWRVVRQWIRDCLWKSKDFLLILKHWLLIVPTCANKSSKDFVGKRMARSIAVWLFWTSWQTFLHPWRPCLCSKKNKGKLINNPHGSTAVFSTSIVHPFL